MPAKTVIEKGMTVAQVTRTVTEKVIVVALATWIVQNKVVVMVQGTVRVKVVVLVAAEVAVDKLIDNGPFIPTKIKDDHRGKFYFFYASA